MLTLTQYDHAILATMDDGKVNALAPALLASIDAALDLSKREEKALVLMGREGIFSAGFDMKIMTSGPEVARELVAAGCRVMMRMLTHPYPVVSACSGHAIAGGGLLLLASDLRIGTPGDFKIGLNEVSIGLPLPIFAVELARERLAPQYLAEATLCGQLFDPAEAIEVGYLDRTSEDLAKDAIEAASELAKLNARAYARTKLILREHLVELVNATLDEDLAENLRLDD